MTGKLAFYTASKKKHEKLSLGWQNVPRLFVYLVHVDNQIRPINANSFFIAVIMPKYQPILSLNGSH